MPHDIRAIVFDLDGTLTPVASPWRLVHEHFGVWDTAVEYHDRFFKGEIDYDTWCSLDAGLWKGRGMHEVQAVLDGIPPTPEALQVLSQVAAHTLADGSELRLLILSSGFEEIGRRVVAQAGLAPERVHVIANSIAEENGVLVGVPRVALNKPGHDKRAHLDAFLKRHNLLPTQAIAVDDRAQDRALFAHLADFVHIAAPGDILNVLDYLV